MGSCCGTEYTKPKDVQTQWYTQFFEGLPRMEGKVVAVTGCSTGTGLVCARDCAKLGAHVVLLNRPSPRAEEALRAIQAAAPKAKVTDVPCDLTSFASVRAAGTRLRKELASSGLDVLCCNAGVMALTDFATEDGCDVQMQTNHLSHFLLASELWPLLDKAAKAKGDARLVSHSSMARLGAPLDRTYLGKNGGNLGGDAGGMMPFSGPRWERYHQTKLANLVFTLAVRDRAARAGSKVKAICAHPGVAATNLQVTSVAQGSMSSGLADMVVSQSAEDGTMGIMMGCCSPDAKSGDFFGPLGMGMYGKAELMPAEPEEKLADEASRNMLWEESEKTIGIKFVI